MIARAPQLAATKAKIGRVRIDTPREIAANKVGALLSRNEPKDLVDLKALLDTGLELETVLSDAAVKDSGANAGNLAFSLGAWRIGPNATLPGGGDPDELERFRQGLVDRLARLAFEETRGR